MVATSPREAPMITVEQETKRGAPEPAPVAAPVATRPDTRTWLAERISTETAVLMGATWYVLFLVATGLEPHATGSEPVWAATLSFVFLGLLAVTAGGAEGGEQAPAATCDQAAGRDGQQPQEHKAERRRPHRLRAGGVGLEPGGDEEEDVPRRAHQHGRLGRDALGQPRARVGSCRDRGRDRRRLGRSSLGFLLDRDHRGLPG